MSTILTFISVILGRILFLFFYWLRLREDYHSNEIFTSGFVTIFLALGGGVLGTFLGKSLPENVVFEPRGLWFWTAMGGGLIGFLVTRWRFKFRIIESFEAASIGAILFLAFTALNVGMFIICCLLFSLYLFLNSKYRRFSWYKSGRVGLAGLLTLIVFFLLRVVLVISPLHSYFSYFLAGRVDALVSILVAFCLSFMAYNLSQSR
jgi:hypothetical protein